MAAATFRLHVVSLQAMLFDEQVKSVYLTGDEGEYELLPFHFPLMGALVEGVIKIRDFEDIPIKSGVVMFHENTCTIIVEAADGYVSPYAKPWAQTTVQSQQKEEEEAAKKKKKKV